MKELYLNLDIFLVNIAVSIVWVNKLEISIKFFFIINFQVKELMKTLFISLTISLVILTMSCSEDVSSSVDSVVRVKSELSGGLVQSINSSIKIPSVLKSEVDSVKITRVRLLLSGIKFHSVSETNEDKDINFKTGPYLYDAKIVGTNPILAEGNLATGIYNKIKFEIHRFSASEQTTYNNDITFSEFATQDRYTVIMDGFAYQFGTAFPFTYKASPTANLSLKLEPSVELTKNISMDIFLQLNPINFLKIGNSVLDPRDSTNENDINYLIQSAIKAIKK